MFLNRTPLYGESGGQAADAGQISGAGFTLQVLDVQKPVKGLFSHRVRVEKGEITNGASVLATVDPDWRLGACQSHSATHVVHAALRQVLGPEAMQSGSFNRPGFMRLDFSWNEPLSDQTKAEIEEVANLAIRSDLAVSAQFMSVQQAKDFGAIALFGETYDEQVRVVQIGGPWSRELCGGTHVARSAQIGLVSVTGESSVGSGSRRIEALVGMDALTSLQNERNLVRRLASQLKVSTGELEQKVIDELSSLKSLEKQIATQRAAELRAKVPELASQAVVQGSLKVLSLQLEDLTADDLRSLALSLKAELGGSAVVILATISAGSATVIVAAGQEALAAGVKAGSLVSIASKILGGGGGGKPDLAQGGGTEIQSLQKALAAAVASI